MKRSDLQPRALWTERLLLLLLTAVTLAAVDQWVKVAVATPPWAFHHRSSTWFLGSCVLLLAALPLARVPSKTVAVAAGIFCGGVLGNLLSASTDALNVPNPILIGSMTGGVAFNAADTFIVSGNLMLMLALIVVTLRHRERFAKHALERAIWRRVRGLPRRG